MTVGRVLSGKGGEVVSVSPDDSLETAAQVLVKHGIGAILAMRGDEIAGVLSERDIVRAVGEGGAGALQEPVSALMTSSVITCRPQDTIAEVMGVMTERRIRHVPVVEEGRLVGIVSIGDLVKERIAQSEHEAAALRDYISTG
ncbi:MAG: CBS domain-containing protein [Rhodospirillales bacterium]